MAVSEQGKARFSAMNMLARREHSRTELEKKLGARFEPDLVAQVLDELVKEGLQSDQRFIESFVTAKVNNGQGPLKIAYQLRSKGVASEAVADELQKYDSEWLQLARDCLHRKFGEQPPVDHRDRQKRQRFIAGRGFSNDICYRLFS